MKHMPALTQQENLQTFFSIAKKLFTLALPMASVQLVSIGGSFLCMMMLAKLGPQVLAASALIFSTQVTMLVAGGSILFSLSLLIGHAFGAKNYLSIGNFVQQGWTLSLIIAIPLMILCWNIKKVLLMTGQAPALCDIAESFFHVFLFAVPASLMLLTSQQLCYGIHRQRIVTLCNRLSVIILLLSAYLLIFGKLGLPRLGVVGLAYAIILQNWISLFFMLAFFYFDKNFKEFALFHYRVHKDWSYLTKMFSVGWPISLQISGELCSFFVFAIMVGWLGTIELSAYQVVVQYMLLVVVPLFALAQASGIMIGQACGAKQFDVIKKLGHASLLLTCFITLVVAGLFFLIPNILTNLYLDAHQTHRTEILHFAAILFAITAISQIFDGIRNTMTGALRGLFDTRYPMWVALIIIWLIGIPLGYVMGFKLHLGLPGVAAGMAGGIFIGMLLILQRWHKLSNKQ